MDVNSTSDFGARDIQKLNINYEKVNDVTSFIGDDVEPIGVDESLYIKDIDKVGILTYKDNTNLNKVERSLCKYISRIVENSNITIGTSESHTDNFVAYLLRKMCLDEDPYCLSYHPAYKFYVKGKWITSIPEFGVDKDGMVIFIDEDKHINNIGNSKAWGEYQIAGELLAVAYTNYNKIYIGRKRKETTHQTLYSMRVIGTQFTFYKAIVSHSYLDSLSENLPTESFTIYRYPSNDDESYSHFDYLKPVQRKKIIYTIYKLRSILDAM
jgi:hypothetical protein